MTTVVNVKVKYIRPKYNNLKEWCDNPNNVYIGRKGVVFIDGERYPKEHSLFANPYKTGDAIQQYKDYLQKKMDDGIITNEHLFNLKGKSLGCWCKEPDRHVNCHGDIILQYIK